MHLGWSQMIDALSKPEPKRLHIKSTKELSVVLDDIHSNSRYPILAQLFSDQKKSMAIGLGSQMSFLAYYEDNDIGPCYYSLNPEYYNKPYNSNIDSTDFFYFGADTEILERYYIDIHTAKSVICEFFETEKMSEKITWELA
ncbi:MAG: hypothetical protein LBU34_14940 [Planctomycetaceae bacterium]|jgi:hypothetical protein|nr:hypothetical protein [Planctomycetaceae bacterium]